MDDQLEKSWIAKNWRALAAIAYLLICLFDFVIMPLIVFFAHDSFSEMAKNIAGLPPEVQRVALDRIWGPWTPLTLQCNGIFHISFGSLISTMAWKHSSEVVESMRQMTARAALINNMVPQGDMPPPVPPQDDESDSSPTPPNSQPQSPQPPVQGS